MDGSSFKNKIKPSATTAEKTEEVIFLNKFIFDLQRFAVATTFELVKDTSANADGNTWLLRSGSQTLEAALSATDIPANATIKFDDSLKTDGIQTTSAVTIAKDLTLDLNSVKWTYKGSNENEYAVNVAGRTLTIKDSSSGGSIAVASDTTKQPTALFNLNGGNLDVQSGTIGDETNTKCPLVEITSADSSLNVADGVQLARAKKAETEDYPAYITDQTAGSNVKINDYGSKTVDDVTNYYMGDAPLDSEVAVASVVVGGATKLYNNLQFAINAAQEVEGGGTVTLLKSVALTATTLGSGKSVLEINGDVTFDLGTFYLSAKYENSAYTGGVFAIGAGGNLTLSGSGSIIGLGGTIRNTNAATYYAAENSSTENKAVVSVTNGGTFTLSGSAKVIAASGIAVYSNASTVNVNGGNITSGLYDLTSTTVFNNGQVITGQTPSQLTNTSLTAITDSNADKRKAGQGINAENGSTVSITGGTIEVSVAKTTDTAPKSQAVFNRESEVTVSTATLKGFEGVFIVGNGVEGSAKLTVESGTIEGNGAAIRNRGNDGSATDASSSGYWNEGGTYIVIESGNITGYSGATISDDGRGMYLPGVNSTTIINGGTITGNTEGIEIRAGNLEVHKAAKVQVAGKSSTDTYVVSNYAYEDKSRGSTTNGAGIAVAQHTTNAAINVIIDGANVSGPVGVSVANLSEKTDAPVPEVTIKNGATITGTSTPKAGTSGSETVKYAVNNVDSRVSVNIEGANNFTGAIANDVKNFTNNGTVNKVENDNQKGTYDVAQGAKVPTDNVTSATLSTAAGVSTAPYVTTSGGTYKITSDAEFQKEYVAVVTTSEGKTYVESLAEAFEVSGATSIKLLKDVTDFAGQTISSAVTLDLAGHTITSTAATAFTVSAPSDGFVLKDSAGGGIVTTSDTLNKSPLISVSSEGVFKMEGGTLKGFFQLISSRGTSVSITGNSTLDLDNTDTSNATPFAIDIRSGTLDIGEKGVTNKSAGDAIGENTATSIVSGPKIIVKSSIAGSDFTSKYISAINLDTGAGAAIINYADISVTSTTGIVRAINAGSSSTLTFKGGKITADGKDNNKYDVGIYQAGTGAISITGGNILGEDYGIYQGASGAFTVNESDAQTTITGTEVGAVARSAVAAGAVNLGTDVEYYGASGNITAGTTSFYSTVSSGVYNLSDPTLTGSNNSWNYQYGFANAATNNFISSVKSAAFTGNLFTEDSLGLVNLSLDSTGTKVSLASFAGLNLVEGASLQGNDLVESDNDDLKQSGYQTLATVSALGSSTEIYAYRGAGAETAGFDFASNKLTYHAASTDQFTLQTGIEFTADSSIEDAAVKATQWGGAFSVTSAVSTDDPNVTVKTITLINPESVFGANADTNNGKGLWLYGPSSSDYKLTVADDFKVSLKATNTFDQATVGTEEKTAVWQYMAAGGGINATNGAQAGYVADDNKITFHRAAMTFAFKDNDSTAIKFNTAAKDNPDAYFTLDSAHSNLTIKAGALATSQEDGATLGFLSGYSQNYHLAFAEGVVTLGNAYSSVSSIAYGTPANNLNNYIYTGTGMATAGYRFVKYDDNGVAQTEYDGSNQKITETIAYSRQKPGISLRGSAAFSGLTFNSDNGSVVAAGDYFDLKGSVLTFKSTELFGNDLTEGASIGVVAGQNYSLALDVATLGSSSADNTNKFTLAGGINSEQKYDTTDRLFTGVGASLAGWEASTGSALTYHTLYDQVKFAAPGTDDKDLLATSYIGTAADFAKSVTIGAADGNGLKTIYISAGAFGDTTKIADGASFSLDNSAVIYGSGEKASYSSERYNLALSGMSTVDYVSVNAFSMTEDVGNWLSKGAYGKSGFNIQSGTDDSSKHFDNMTFHEQQKSVQFTVSAGDSNLLATDKQNVADAISANGSILGIDIAAFSSSVLSPGDGEFKFGLNGDSATNFSVSLTGSGYNLNNLANGTVQSIESFTGGTGTGVYVGKGIVGENSKGGYTLVDNNKAVAYYTKADTFSLGGSAVYRDFDASASVISDFFDVKANTAAVTIKAGALNMDSLAQGTTMSITGANSSGTNYTLVLGAGIASANNARDTIGVENVGSNAGLKYTGVGAQTLGFADTSKSTLFTYYDQYKTFQIAGANIGFAGSVTAVATASRDSVQAILEEAIKFGGDGDSVVTFNDLSIFNPTATDGTATLAIATFGTGTNQTYSVQFADDISLASAFLAPTLMGGTKDDNDVYTYNFSSIGADKQGFYSNSTIGAFQYFDKAETFDITSKIAFDLGSVNAGFSGEGGAFAVSVPSHMVTISAGAFDTLTLSKLEEGYGISIGTSGLNSTVQYGLVFGDTKEDAAYKNFALATMNTINTFTNRGNGDPDSIIGEFKFAGAEANGFETVGAVTGGGAKSLVFHEKADRFTLVGSLGLSSAATQAVATANIGDYMTISKGNTLVSFLTGGETWQTFDSAALKTGATLQIANPDASVQARQYKLTQGELPVATDAQVNDSLTATSTAKVYNYKGRGAENTGVIVSDDGVLTYYDKRDINFNLYSDVELATGINASLISLSGTNNTETVTSYSNVMTVSGSAGRYSVTIGAGAFDSTKFAQGDVVSLNAATGNNSTYSLSFDESAYAPLTSVNDTATVTTNEYSGIGAENAGFYQKVNSIASFTFYEKYNSFDLTTGTNYIGFNTSLTADELNSAVTVTGNTVGSQILIGSTALFNPDKLKTNNKVKLTDDSSAIYGNPQFADSLKLTQADIHDKDTLTSTGDNTYTYTFVGADKEGFIQSGSTFTYHAQSDTLGIESGIALNLDSISAGLATVVAAVHTVGSASNKITISAGALDMENATVGAEITVGQVNGDTYAFVLGNGLNDDATVGATWNRSSALNTGVFREDGYKNNAFSGSGTSKLTYLASADEVTLSVNDSNILTNNPGTAKNYITIGEKDADGKIAVTIGANLFSGARNAGDSLGLATGSGALGYVLNLDAFKSDTNVYYDKASIETGEGTATYTGTGMSSVAGFHVTGEDSLTAMTWTNAASVVGFNTTGGIKLSSEGADYVTITAATSGTNKYVSIGSDALTKDTLFSAAKLSLDAASFGAGYRLALGGDLTAAGQHRDAKFTGTTKTFNSEGADKAGYQVNETANELTYYDTVKNVRFEGNLNFTTDSAAKDYIKLDGNNVIVADGAFDFSTLKTAGANASVRIYSTGYTLSFDSLTSAGSVQSEAAFINDNRTYVGVGAEQNGFVKGNDEKTAVYWTQHHSFSFTSDSDLEIANGAAALVTVTAGTGNTKIIAMTGDVFTGQENDQFIKLDNEAISNGYKLSWNRADSLNSNSAYVAANVNTLTGVFNAFGASQSGYLVSDQQDEITYREKAESFKFVMLDGTSESLMPWNSTLSATALGERVYVGDAQGTTKDVSFSNTDIFNTSGLKGDGTEVFSIVSDADSKYTYKLTNDGWSKVTEADITEGDFDAESKKLIGAGANIGANEGLMQDGNAVKYYRKAAEVTLGGTAEFEAIPEGGKIADYFTIVGKKVSLKDKALDVITNEAEGVSLTATGSDGTAYTLELADTIKGVGNFVNNTGWNSTNKTYTGIGLSSASGARAGFQLGTNNTVATYHGVADTVNFDANVNFASNADNVRNNITISAAEGDSTVKTVTLGQNALNVNQTEGASIKVATDGYALDMTKTVGDDGTMIGGLAFGGEYTASVTFAALGEEGVWTYRGIGADDNGYIAGDGADSLTLTYHTKRGAQFAVEGNVEFDSTLSSTAAAAYFTVPGGTGARTVTVGKDLFSTAQADGATIKSSTDGYTLTMAAADQVSLLGEASFDTTTATYIESGANKDGFTASTDGILTFHKQGDNFKFVNESVVSGTDTIYAVKFDEKATAAMFTLDKSSQDGKFITIAKSALSTQQTDGAQLRLDTTSQEKGYKLTLGDLVSSDNTYSAEASFKATEGGGGVYTTEGMSKEAGYVQGADEGTLVYHDKATNLTFTGTLKFKDLTASELTTAILVGESAVTINSAALESIQDSGATLSASDGTTAYKLVLGDLTKATGTPTAASFTANNKVFNSAGTTTAGYLVSGTNDTLLSYYDQVEKVSFTQSTATFNINTNTVANNIKITKDESGNKIVTVGIAAINTLSSVLNDGKTLRINETSKYTLAVDDALSGGTYDPDVAFARKDSVGTADDGTTIYNYTYKYGGADKDGFVKTVSNANYFTYKNQGTTDPIAFQGNLNFNEDMSAADRAGYFTIDTTNKTVSIKGSAITDSLFGTNADLYYLQPTGYKMALTDDFTLKADGDMNDKAKLEESTAVEGYTYLGTGADVAGYMINSEGALVYRGLKERVEFEGDLELNTEKVSDITVADGGVTIGAGALGEQDGNATLSIASYSRGDETLKGTFTLGDSITPWVESEASLTNYNTKYTTAGVSQEGYKLVDGVIDYRVKSTDELTFTGLNSTAKATDLSLEGGLFTIGKNALNKLNIAVSGGTSSYTLAVAGADEDGVYIKEASVPASLSEDKKTYTTFKTAETYTGNGTAAITYASAEGGEAIGFTGLGSGASTENVSLEGTAFTVGAAALDTVNVSVDKEGYTLTLTGVQIGTPDSTVEAATFGSVSGGVAEYARDTLFSEYWTAQGTNAYNYNKAEIATEGLFTLSGVAAVADSIVSSDNKVTLAKSNVADKATSLTLTQTGNTYSLELAGDMPTVGVVTPTTKEFGKITGDTVAFSQLSSVSSYWNKVSGDEAYTLVAETDGTPVELFTLKGVKSVEDTMVSGNKVSIAKANVADEATSFSLTNSTTEDTYSFVLAEDLPTAATEIGSMTAFSAVTNNEAVFSKTSTLSSFWAKEDNTETYNFTPESVQAGQGLFTLSGVSAVDNDMVDGTNVEIAAANMVDSVTAVNLTGDNYTLVLGEGLTASSVKAKAYDASSMTFNTAGNTEGYTVVGGGKTINHVNSSVDEFKFTGLNDKAATKYFTPNADDKTIMVHADATKTDGTPVSLTAAPTGYKLAFGSSMTKKASETYTKNYDADTMTYTTAGQTQGYSLASDGMSINYITADKATGMAFKFTGLNDKAATKYFTPDTKAKTIMVHADATKTDGTTLKLTSAPSGYKLAFGSSMTREASETYKKEYDSKTMTYTTAGQTQGYVLASDGMSIDYITAAKATGLKFTFTGLNDKAATKYFTPDTKAKTIMVHADATKTDGTALKLTSAPSGYKLAFGSSMTREASETYTKNYDAKTMTYTTAGQTQGYSLASDGMSINYITAAKATGMAFKFTGLNSKAATKHFTVNSNKTIMVHADAAPTTDGAVIKLTDAPTGYKLAFGSSMTKKAATTGGTLSGTTYTYGQKAGYTLSSDAMSITYSKADTKLKLTGVASKVSDPASNGTVSLKLANFGSNLAISSNSGKYKFSVASGTYTGKKLTGSTGADTITSAGARLTVNLGKGNDSLVSTGANVTVTAGAGNDYVKATGTRSVVNGGDGKDTILGGSGNDKFYGGAGNDSINGGAGKDSLRGDAGADVLQGGAGNDSLWGGAGNDSLYGGAGNDTFIYKQNEGTDTIFDYASGDLVQLLNSKDKAVGYTNATFSGGNLTLAVSGGGSLVLRSMSVGDKVNINGKSHTITNSGLN